MSTSMRMALLQGANVATFLAVVIVNTFASFSGINGRTTGQVSDLYPTLVTPAGYVFIIWTAIYALLLIFAVFQASPKRREEPFLSQIGILFVLSAALNILWLFLWHYLQIVLSIIPMFLLLATLIAIYLRLQIGKSSASLKEKLYVHLPFSVYLGWITVASIADVAAALTSVGWDTWGLGDVTWAVLVIIAALLITLAVVITRKDIAYGLVIVWALAGIAVKQAENQTIVTTASTSAAIAAIAVLATAIYSITMRKSKPPLQKKQNSA